MDDTRLNEKLARAELAGRCLRARNAQSRRVLRRRAEKGILLAVREDLFARPEYWNGLPYRERIMHVLRSVGAAHPNWVLGQISAAAVWGLHETYVMHDIVHIATGLNDHSRDRRYFRFHCIRDMSVEIRDGLRVTDLMQTVFDCARMLPFPEGLAICDRAMNIHGLESAAMESFLDDHRGFRGIETARKVVAYADARSENGGESIARGLLIDWGYERPLLQQWVTDPVTGRSNRVDFLWRGDDGQIIVMELDGREKYVNPDMLGSGDGLDAILAEKERESNIRLLGGIRFVRVSFKQLMNDPATVRFKLDLAGVPRRRDGLGLR